MGLAFIDMEKKKPRSDQRYSQISGHGAASTAAGTEGKKDQMDRLSERDSSSRMKTKKQKIIDENRKKNMDKNGSLRNTSAHSKEAKSCS